MLLLVILADVQFLLRRERDVGDLAEPARSGRVHDQSQQFTTSRSAIIVAQIFHYFFDGIRDELDSVKNNILNQKTTLTNTVDQLQKQLSAYQTTVEVGDDFVR